MDGVAVAMMVVCSGTWRSGGKHVLVGFGVSKIGTSRFGHDLP